MTRFTRPVLALLLTAIPALHAVGSDNDQYFHWFENYDDAILEAKVTGKPILLAFRCVP